MQLNVLNSFFIAKLAQVAFHIWVVWHVCILDAAHKRTLLNVLNNSFTMFFPALSSTSLIRFVFYGPDISFYAFYETGVLAAMVMANTVTQICRSKIIKENNAMMYEIFFHSETESKEIFLGPIMIIAFQALFVVLCFCRKMYIIEPRKPKTVKNDYSPRKMSVDSCIECQENSTEKCHGMESNFEIRDRSFSNPILSQHENIESNVMGKDTYVLKDTIINNESNCKDMMESKENICDVGSKEKKKIKPSPRLFVVPNNCSNPSKEMDSTNSEITFENYTCFSESDTDEDISLGTIRMDNSTSNISVFSVIGDSQFAKELVVGSSSSPRSKNNENVSGGFNDNLDISVQFPMDLTPQKSKSTKVEETSDIKLFSTHSSAAPGPQKNSKNLDLATSNESNVNEKKYSIMLKEFKLTGDTEVEKKFTKAVNIFEMIYNCNFLEWLFKTTKFPNDIPKFIRYVEGKSNKEKIEKNLREWINVVVTSCKNIDIKTNPNRKFHKEIQLAFMKNDQTFKQLRKDCKKALNEIEDLRRPNRYDDEKLVKCYTTLATIDDDYVYMCSENEERAEKEKIYVNYLTLENTLESKRTININTGLERSSREKEGTVLSQKDPNLDKLQEYKFPVTRKDIFALHQLELNPAPFVENCKIIGEDSKPIQVSVGKEGTDYDIKTIRNILLEGRTKTGFEENIKNNCEDQEKNVNVGNEEDKNKMNFVEDSKALKLNLTNEEEYTQGTKFAFDIKKIGDSENTNPSHPISIKVKEEIDSDSDSEDECNDVIEFFEKIQKSVDEKKSLSAEVVFKKYGRVYYGGDSFLKAKKYIKEKHEKNSKRRKEQEEEIQNTIEDLYAQLNEINPQKTKFQKDLASTRIEINDWDYF